MKLSNTLYDILNKLQRWLPLISALYVGLADTWGLPLAPQIEDTIKYVVIFLAGILETSTFFYNKEQKALESVVDYNEEQG